MSLLPEEARASLVEAMAAAIYSTQWPHTPWPGALDTPLQDKYRAFARVALAVVESAAAPCETCGGDGLLPRAGSLLRSDPSLVHPCDVCREHPGRGPLLYVDLMRGAQEMDLKVPSEEWLYLVFPRAAVTTTEEQP